MPYVSIASSRPPPREKRNFTGSIVKHTVDWQVDHASHAKKMHESMTLAWFAASLLLATGDKATSAYLSSAIIVCILCLVELHKAVATSDASVQPKWVAGSGSGTCLLCPGLQSNIAKTVDSAPYKYLAKRFAVVVVFDYSPESTCIEHLVDDAMRVLILCGGPGSCAITGYSMGGAVAMHLAARARECGWIGTMNIELFASPAHVRDGIDLPLATWMGVQVFAHGLDISDACERIGAPSRLRLVHALDDVVVSIEHSNVIFDAATRSGMDAVIDILETGGHRLKTLADYNMGYREDIS